MPAKDPSSPSRILLLSRPRPHQSALQRLETRPPRRPRSRSSGARLMECRRFLYRPGRLAESLLQSTVMETSLDGITLRVQVTPHFSGLLRAAFVSSLDP